MHLKTTKTTSKTSEIPELTCCNNMKKDWTLWINTAKLLTQITQDPVKGRFLPTDGNQLATWLPENTWAAVWSQDANEAEGKVEADLPTSWERRN